MAFARILFTNLCREYNKICIQNFSTCSKNVLRNNQLIHNQNYSQFNLTLWRYSHSFFSRTTAEQLWKGVLSVSPAGRKKGRAKGRGRKMAKDLNRGQVIGFGKKNMLWPGLNAPIVQGREVLHQQELPPDDTREKRIIELREKLRSRKPMKIHPLERGWSGTKLHGRRLGPPDPIGDEIFENFDSMCLQLRVVSHMHGVRGRVRRFKALVIVGNANGLAGFACATCNTVQLAAKKAKNKAARVLRYVERDNNTVIHDFFTQFGAVRIFVERRPEGYGLVCHRALKGICQMLGIKDMYAKVEGPSHNTQNLTKAFFIGLMKQKSLKQIAEEKGLHIVRRENYRSHFPVVVASPEKCRTEDEISPTELVDFKMHLHNGKVVEERKKFQPFYINFPSYIKEMKDREKTRNFRSVRIQMLAKYGAVKSYVQVREEEKAKQMLKDSVEET